MPEGPSPEWTRFRNLLSDAIRRGAAEHHYLGTILCELHYCELALRHSENDISEFPGPIARELAAAIEAYEEAGRPGGYSNACAAKLVLVAMAEKAQAAEME